MFRLPRWFQKSHRAHNRAIQIARRAVQRSRSPLRATLQALEDRLAMAPVPVVTVNAPNTAMIGESTSFSVTFDNQASGAPTTGYGPYVDLFVDTTGADGVSPGAGEPNNYDGLSGLSASFLGATLTPISVTLGAGGTFTHPIARTAAGALVTGTAPTGFVQGDTLLVYVLPFGSFVDTQPTAQIDITANVSSEADLNTPLNLAAIGGFRYGSDPLDNFSTDVPIRGATATDTIAPTLITLTKEYLGPEDETASGPNYPRQYRIIADVANGQTITDLRISDFLPNNLAFLSVVSTSPSGETIEQTPTVGAAANAPNNDLIVHWGSILGGLTANDASVTFEFFVPEFDANGTRIISATTGDDVTSVNDSRATGNWDPTDVSDPSVTVNIVTQADGADDHTLTDKSIAIQKSVEVFTDTGATGPSPGDTMLYTLEFQISDYFTFGDLVVEDIFSDGQRLQGSPGGPFPGPFTLSVTDRNGVTTGNFTPNLTNGASNLFIDLSQIGNDANPSTDGSTRLVFDVSRAMTELGAADGILQGGRAIAPNSGAATGTITYRTIVQQQFSDDYPSGNQTVDQGDHLDNQVTITGSVRDNSAINTTVGTEVDDSQASFDIVTGNILKTIYAVNGTFGPNDPSIDPDTGLVVGPSYSNAFQVRPGDVVTYRIRYVHPTGDIEDFRITDYLPLPVYDASIISTVFNATVDSVAPAADSAKYGPAHTFSGSPPAVNPTITVDAAGNSVEFDWGVYDSPPPESPTVIDLLLSVTITDAPMADNLFLTNQVEAHQGTTNAGFVDQSAIVQVTLTEPVLNVRKGIVSTSNATGQFSSTVAPTGITFEAPGQTTPLLSFSGGTISSGNLGTTLNANLSRVDADDLVKFAIVVENTGNSSAGAFDVRIRDTLPAGFVVPSGGPGLNLEVFDGSGEAMTFATLGTGFFDVNGGIELDDPGPTLPTPSGSPPVIIDGGALDEFHASSGRNIAIITFDLQVAGTVEPGQANPNTATVFNYAGIEGGDDHTDPTNLTDTAQVTIANPSPTKTLISTSVNSATNSNTQAVIGEIATYEVVVAIPEGEMSNAQIVDTLGTGLAFVDVVSVSSSAALTIQNAITTGTSPANTTIPSGGNSVTFNLGDITNSNRDNGTAETITIRYRAVVLNVAGNQNSPATNLTNAAQVTWTGGSVNATSPTVQVIEPILNVSKLASPTTADAGDTVTFTVAVTHTAGSNTDAFDVSLTDVIPAGMSYVAGSLTHTLGVAPGSLTESGGTITATWTSIPHGQLSNFTFQVTLNGTVQPGQTITNTATGTWTSLSGPTSSDISIHNTNSRERTGAGGVNDYSDPGSAGVSITASTGKSLATTAESSTTGTQVAIGEIARYHLVTQVPEGTATNFQIADQLPTGLQFLNDGTIQYAFVSNGAGISSSTLGNSSTITGASGNVTPTFVLPVGAISGGPFVGGTDPTFSFGNLTNADNDADSEFLVLEFNVIALNVAGNVAGTSLNNTYTLLVNGAQVGSPSNGVALTVVEPSLTNIVKGVQTPAAGQVDGGQVATYSFSFSNSNAANSTTAFDVRVNETLPAGLTSLTNIRVFRNSAQIFAGFTNNSTSSVLDVVLDQVAPNDTIVILYDATVSPTSVPGSTINNTATVTYTSLPGLTGTAGNPTGSVPGVSGSGTGERTGAGGVNTYTGNDGAAITVHTHTISGFVYRDNNNNGLLDDGVGVGIANVSVTLTGTDHLSNPVNVTLQTGANGDYSFTGLRPGTYTVTETQPSAFLNGRDTLGAPALGAVNSDIYDNSLATFTITVGSNNVVSANNNFGELTPAQITGFVYIDANNNGLRGAETGLDNITINLTGIDDRNNSVTASTVTAPDGSYSFGNLRPGDYTVTEVAQPSTHVDGFETRGNVTAIVGSAGGPDVINSIIVSAGQTAAENNFGEVPPSTVSGRVFADVANDGQFNASDTGIDGVVIELTGTDVNNNPVTRTTTTSGGGFYSFTNLLAGTYVVSEPVQPAGHFDGQDARNNVVLPNSIGTDTIPAITVGIGATAPNNNFGEVPEVDPTGYVYIDSNQDGVRNPGEIGVFGVEIRLSAPGLDVFGNPFTTLTAFTDQNGFYQFAGLPPNTYTITEIQPAGFIDGQEENGTPPAATVNNDQFVGIDLTVVPFGGDYNFGEISPTGSLAGSVFVDRNNNGVRDPGEIGLPGVTILLQDENNANNTASVVTDSAGNYRFIKMAPGSFRLTQVHPTNFVDGRDVSGTLGGTAGNDTISGIVVGVNQAGVNYLFGELGLDPSFISKRIFLSSSNVETLTGPAGSGVTAVNAPLADPSGYVYVDANENNQRDLGELGITGVRIDLSGITTTGQIVEQTTFTDGNGFYQFAFLAPGVYALRQTQPAGYIDGAESLGSLGGQIVEDGFDSIVVEAGELGTDYNFGEREALAAPAGDRVGVRRGNVFVLDHDATPGASAGDHVFSFGNSTDIPLVGDWDGDGVDQMGVRRNNVFYLDKDGDRIWDPAIDVQFPFGLTSDKPIVGDWDGDGIDQIGVVRNNQFYLDENNSFTWDSGDSLFLFGLSTDTPLVGDWDGDGRDNIGVWRSGWFYLDQNGSRTWDASDVQFRFGLSNDRPIVGDWDGDGRDQIGVQRVDQFFLDYGGNNEWDRSDVVIRFGITGDAPLVGRWNRPSARRALRPSAVV